MKKALLAVAVAALAATYAPEARAQLFAMGVKGGLLVNSERLKFTNGTNDFDGKSTRAGFEAGLQFTVNLPLVPILIQPEIVYSRTSATYETGNSNAGDLKLRSNMFSIPVLVGMKFSSFRVMAGPVFTFPSMDRVSMDNLNEQFAPRYKDFLIGLQAGVGVTLGRVTIDARYHWQFTGLSTSEVSTSGKISNVDIKNGRFAFSLGYTIFRLL